MALQFLPTPSARRATPQAGRRGRVYRHFYPRPPRGGRPRKPDGEGGDTVISTHALREEGDEPLFRLKDIEGVISTHALREEGDASAVFTSTRLLNDFYPRPPRGGRLDTGRCDRDRRMISTHALREEGDLNFWEARMDEGKFLPTPSARRATKNGRICAKNDAFLPTPSARRATAAGIAPRRLR